MSGPMTGRWPWPADTVLDRCRRLLTAYREALLRADPSVCAQLDEWALEHGQTWVVPSAWPYADDELLTLTQAAQACHVQVTTVYRWHQRGLRYIDTPDGARVRAGDLIDFARARRLARRK